MNLSSFISTLAHLSAGVGPSSPSATSAISTISLPLYRLRDFFSDILIIISHRVPFNGREFITIFSAFPANQSSFIVKQNARFKPSRCLDVADNVENWLIV